MPSNDMMNDESCEYLFELFGRLHRGEISPEDAKEEITSYLGGSRIRIRMKPKARLYVGIAKAIEAGVSPTAIAERYGTSTSYVFHVRKALQKIGGDRKTVSPLFHKRTV